MTARLFVTLGSKKTTTSVVFEENVEAISGVDALLLFINRSENIRVYK